MAEFFFGERWDAPMLDDANEIPTPVGKQCGYCEEVIVEGDSGLLQTFVDLNSATQNPVHIECLLVAILGDVFHHHRQCSCYGGSGHDDRPHRERGRALVAVLKEE